MSLSVLDSLPKSRLKALLDHFGRIDDPRQPSQVAHPLPEVLLLVVCGTICDCESYELIAEWGKRASGGVAPVSALLPWRARRALAHHPDEPHQPGPVPGGLHGLGQRDLAGPSRPRSH